MTNKEFYNALRRTMREQNMLSQAAKVIREQIKALKGKP